MSITGITSREEYSDFNNKKLKNLGSLMPEIWNPTRKPYNCKD